MEAEEFRGTALNGAIEVTVDERGRVVSVWLDPWVVRRLWPERLEQSVLLAHAKARAAAALASASGR